MLLLKWFLIHYYKEMASHNLFIGHIKIIKPIKYELQKKTYYTTNTTIDFITH